MPDVEQMASDSTRQNALPLEVHVKFETAPRLRAVRPDDEPPGPAQWSGRVVRLLSHEIRWAVASAVLTAAEADQLLARLVLVIDQAMTPSHP